MLLGYTHVLKQHVIESNKRNLVAMTSIEHVQQNSSTRAGKLQKLSERLPPHTTES